MKHSVALVYGAMFAIAILMAVKPIQAAPSFELADGSELTFGGEVSFDVVGAPPKAPMQIDIQCYGSVAGGTDNVGWWDTGATDKVFVLGSHPTTAPPDMGSVIYLRWEDGVAMDCDARLFTVSKKGVVNVLDALSFSAM